MRSVFGLCSLLILFLVPAPPAEAQGPGFRSAVNSQVRAARRVAPELGVHVKLVETDETVYSYNPDVKRIIASNTKLITTATALDRLGPGHFFETKVLVAGTRVGDVLRGHLAIVGGGDPHISGRGYGGDPLAVFREWAAALGRIGIRRVDGDLILVHGFFDGPVVHPDWPRDQLTRWYEAPVAALSFSDNCVLVEVRPGRVGGAARVRTRPELPLFRVQSRARTTGHRRNQRLTIDRRRQPGMENVIDVGGWIYRHTDVVDKWIAVADPIEYFGAALREAFRQEGVEITGRTRARATLPPPEAPTLPWRRLHNHRTDLLTALEVINKRSQNFYAESVMKLLGAELCGKGTWAKGIEVAEEFLADGPGIPASDYRLADGSGMSRNNRFTPEQLTRLLRFMYYHRWSKEFIRTLPYSGEPDLSWRKRLSTVPYRGNVMAKTGSLNGVSTLSGYAKARSGKLYAFSILCNRARSGWQAKAAQDRIVRAIIDHG